MIDSSEIKKKKYKVLMSQNKISTSTCKPYECLDTIIRAYTDNQACGTFPFRFKIYIAVSLTDVCT